MRYPLKCCIIKKEEALIMSRQKPHHTKQFKLDAINYHKEHPELTQVNRFNIINYKHSYKLVFEYIETFYNTVKIHSHCDYMSPNNFEKLYERVCSLPAA